MTSTFTPPPLLVFDLDGTVADTAVDLVATLNAILTREGLAAIPFKDAVGMVGSGAKALLQRGLKANDVTVDEKRLDELFTDYLAHYEAHIADDSTLYPGVTKALDRFEAAGWTFAICTNKVESSARLLLTALGVAQRFKAICGKDTFDVSKPDGDALLQTIAKAGGDPRRAIMVGDSRTDIDTAKNAKVPVVAVTFGYTDLPVETFEPDRIVKSFDELFDAVEELSAVFHVA
ncbi:HAD-IA family hydrolase [Methylocella sp.]|uniref:HAD-IA family hydrolase n=1 Tax=Methylocella sp. TaxID=1978226 RepID=UPI00378504FD